MITLYNKKATDYTTNGLVVLDPYIISAKISERLNGEYKLDMELAVDPRTMIAANEMIVKAPAPIRETPQIDVSSTQTVTREIYKVTTGGQRLYLRVKPTTSSRAIKAYKPGTEVAILDKSNSQWYKVAVLDGGASGYMYAANLTYVRSETQSQSDNKPQTVTTPAKTRDQLFRISKITSTLESIQIEALHISYDMRRNYVKSAAVKGKTGTDALAAVFAAAMTESDFTLYSDISKTCEEDIAGKSLVAALLSDGGLVDQAGGEVLRDNYDLYWYNNIGYDRGVSIAYRKNMAGMEIGVDTSDIVTQIIPVGYDKKNNPIYGDPVDSAHVAEYAHPYIKEYTYKDVKVGKDYKNEAAVKTELAKRAAAEYDAKIDLPKVSATVEYVDLKNTSAGRDFAAYTNVYIGDTVRIRHEDYGFDLVTKVVAYVWDCVVNEYESIELDNKQAQLSDIKINPSMIGNGTLASRKLGVGAIMNVNMAENSVESDQIAEGAIDNTNKMTQLVVDALSTASLTAQIAYINALNADTIKTDELTAAWAKLYTIIAEKITAGEVTADTITAAMAKLTKASVEHAEIDWANISKLTAAMATIANANIGTAKIDWAKIYDLTADTAIISEGVGGKLYIARLAVTEANMTSLTVGELMVKAADGSFKRLTVDADGSVSAETVEVEGGNVADATISGGKLIENTITARELNVESIFADTALIRAIKAANIDVSDLFAAQATISALDSWLIKADTISALKGELNLWANDKITAAVGALAIGGTNLIKGTRKMTAANWYGMTGTGKSLVTLDNDYAGEKIERSGLTSAAYTSCYAKTDNVITAGKAYILTADSYIDPSGTALDGNASLTLVFYSASGSNLQSTAARLSSESPTGAWKRLEVKATAPDNAAYAQITMMLSKNGNVTFARLKLEEGNKATAWSPAPEDTDDSINSVKSELNLVPGEISAAVNNVQVGGTNLVRLGALAIVNASGRAAEQLSKTWYRESEHQTTILPYSGGACWLNCPNISIAAGKKYTLSYYAWIQPDAESGANKFRPNLFGGTTDTDKYLTDFIAFVRGAPTKYTVTFDTTGWTAGDYALRFVMLTGQTHEVYFTDIKLEEGNKATAWSPSPNEVRIGTNILLDLYHTLLKTPYFEVDVSGENGDFRADENGLTVKVGTFEQIYCPEIVKYYAGAASVTLAAGSDLTVISDALRNRILPYNVTITLAGDVTGRLTLAGMSGRGNVIINAAGHTLNGCVVAINNAVGIEINNLTVSRALERQCVNIERCASAKLYQCVFNGNGMSNGQGVRAVYSRLFVQGCEFYNLYTAFAMSYCAELVALGNKGSVTEFLWVDGMTGRFAGTRPSGTVNKGNPSFLLPADPTTLTIDTGSAAPVETPVTTSSYTANVTGTYYPSGHWISGDNYIRQGFEGKESTRSDYGCMWFSASALAGKTIKSATLTLTRRSGRGRSGSVTITLWTTTHTGKSGVMASSTLTSLGEIGTIQNGETATFNIPTSAISVIAAGGGLVTYTGETANASNKDYSRNYAHFYGVDTDGAAPVLTVTYQ